jgi:hypothetical protein
MKIQFTNIALKGTCTGAVVDSLSLWTARPIRAFVWKGYTFELILAEYKTTPCASIRSVATVGVTMPGEADSKIPN